MSEELIREIAQEIVRQMPPMGGWAYYVILVLCMVASAFLGAYLRKRGETYATKADMEEVLKQLKETTQTVEEVRTAVAHQDWQSREWKTLRRTKLEELSISIHEIHATSLSYMREIIFAEQVASEELKGWKVVMLCMLYFPDLKGPVQKFLEEFYAYQQWAIAKRAGLKAVKGGSAECSAFLAEAIEESKPMVVALRKSVEATDVAAAKLMRDFFGA